MVKKKKAKKSKTKKINRGSNLFLVLAIICLLVLVIFIVANSEFSLEEPGIKRINMTDECGVIAGRMIHQIRDSEDCKLRCKNACGVEDLEFEDHLFYESNSSCHQCSCFCR